MKSWILGGVLVLLGINIACQEVLLEDPESDVVIADSGSDGESEEDPAINTEVYTEYVIRKGQHYSNGNWFRSVKTDIIEFIALFDSSAIYTTVDPANQGDINKLFGLSDCNDLHHYNSARFGWRWYNDRLEIFAYTYMNGARMYKSVGTIPVNVPTSFSIAFEADKYRFQLNETVVEIPRACSGEAAGYKLLPYFGGNETAPHEISILISEK